MRVGNNASRLWRRHCHMPRLHRVDSYVKVAGVLRFLIRGMYSSLSRRKRGAMPQTVWNVCAVQFVIHINSRPSEAHIV